MKLEITEFEKRYSFELLPITQLCGQNLITKTFIIESIRRYFSTFKYAEQNNKWRDNVTIDNNLVGRKFFSIISVQNVQQLTSAIKWSKQSMLTEYVKQLLQNFDCQTHLQLINEEVEKMFLMLNEHIASVGDIELTYSPADVWDMVQKTDVCGFDYEPIEEKNNYELILIFLRLLEEILQREPRKTLIIFENIDHLVTINEYRQIIEKLKSITSKFNIYFILSTSLNNYVVCEPEFCEGISIFGDENFQMPEYSKLSNFIQDNYPSNKAFDDEKLLELLQNIIQKIGVQNYLTEIEGNVICKLINQTLSIDDKWRQSENNLEIAFLKS